MQAGPGRWVTRPEPSTSSWQRNSLIFPPVSVPVLCALKVTTDLLTRDGKDIAFGNYSATWRFHRKVVHGALCMFGEGSASIEKISEYSTRIHI